MTIVEYRKSKDYAESLRKINNYRKGFEFTLNYAQISKAKANALKILVGDCVKLGILESIRMGFDLDGNLTDETYRKIADRSEYINTIYIESLQA